MTARIYRPAKTAMQSGIAGTRKWVLEYTPAHPRTTDPLMGWTGSTDTLTQLRLRFETLAEAENYARRHGIAYRVFKPKPRHHAPKSYSDNFRSDRKQLWTH